MQEGLYINELSKLKKELLNIANKDFSQKLNKYLKTEAEILSKTQKQIASQKLNTIDENDTKEYYNSFKIGEIEKTEQGISINVYNSSAQAQAIEYGYKTQDNKFVAGQYVLNTSENQFRNKYYKDTEKFIIEYFDNIGN